MAQTFDRKILRALQDNGVREIRAYEVVSKNKISKFERINKSP